jgi:hypothetical protein
MKRYEYKLKKLNKAKITDFNQIKNVKDMAQFIKGLKYVNLKNQKEVESAVRNACETKYFIDHTEISEDKVLEELGY